MKIFSWNVNGLRAVIRKNALQEFIAAEQPDILCLQETKAKPGQAEIDLPEYLEIWNSAERPGYSGTAIFTKFQPLSVSTNFDRFPEINAYFSAECADLAKYGDPRCEGRIQTAEFEPFFLVNVYTPNSKPDLSRLRLREQIWDPAFCQYLHQLETIKPVVVCGDFNAAHTPLDLARPSQNEGSAGFTLEERQGIKNLLSSGLIDTFRTIYPNVQRYTWWSHWAKARERNIGWRIDYFFISNSLLPRLESAEIYEHHAGSDHCPISIDLEF